MFGTRLSLEPFLVLAVLFFGSSCSDGSSNPTDVETATEQPLQALSAVVERLPGSRNFSPDATWWGYNMSKVVRSGDFVFTYVIENDDNPSTYSTFRIYVKEGDGPWTAGAGFNTTRPGNILLDSNGALHVFVFEATDIDLNDSVGKLHHYTLAGASAGDITSFINEVVVDHVAGDETVNIRVGAAIGADNQMVIAFGLGTDADGDTEQVLTKTVGGAGWAQETAGTQLGHDFYYPLVAVNSAGAIGILPIQDDFEGVGNPNTYQIIRFFERSGSTSAENVVDHTSRALASTRPRLLEPIFTAIASDGVHILYKEYRWMPEPHPQSSSLMDDQHDRPRYAQPQLGEDDRGRWNQVSGRIEPRPVVRDERGRHDVPGGRPAFRRVRHLPLRRYPAGRTSGAVRGHPLAQRARWRRRELLCADRQGGSDVLSGVGTNYLLLPRIPRDLSSGH